MGPEFEVFDFKRIFIGETPTLFLAEIVFRTIIMYTYTIFLLRLLGKRGMGQLSGLELAIIICFGSAVGDPMIGADIPIIYGAAGITTVAFLQIGLEKIINHNKRLEKLMEGEPQLVVDNGIILLSVLEEENISHEDLFRALRGKDVEHLGQVNKAFFETSGEITVWFHPPKKVCSGLLILPEAEIPSNAVCECGETCASMGDCSCRNCGYTSYIKTGTSIASCPKCGYETWLNNTVCSRTQHSAKSKK